MIVPHAFWIAPAIVIVWTLLSGMRDGYRETAGKSFSDPQQPFLRT
jgi:hypothetical protein